MLKQILRVLLIVSLVFYTFVLQFFPIVMKGITLKNAKAQTEIGIGGGLDPFKIEGHLFAEAELEGIPEPEEFSRPRMLTFGSYEMEKGDMIGLIASKAGLYEDTLISVNNVKNTRLMQIGQVIKVPNQDGIYYTVQNGDTLEKIADKYKTTASSISVVNELFSDTINPKETLFIPSARLDWINKQEINGDLFIWPCSGYLSSNYGYRASPFGGKRQFHSGIDIAAPMGSSIKAAMSGRVTQVGNDNIWGNFVVITHHSGYRTLYAHMSLVRAKTGAYVETGERIGDVGSTGLSTGPHLHFTVYKNGVTVSPRSLMR